MFELLFAIMVIASLIVAACALIEISLDARWAASVAVSHDAGTPAPSAEWARPPTGVVQRGVSVKDLDFRATSGIGGIFVVDDESK